jgi:hypothetical protein
LPEAELKNRKENLEMKIIVLAFVLAAVTTVANAADTFTGIISDTMCGAKPHSLMKLKGQTDGECIKMCTKGPYVYALIDGTNVMKLSDQKTAAKYVTQNVKVTGTYDQKTNTIRVTSIEPVDAN